MESNNNVILGNYIYSNNYYGIYLDYANYNTITNNFILYNGEGCIYEGISVGNVISDNVCDEDIKSEENIIGFNILVIIGILAISLVILIKKNIK